MQHAKIYAGARLMLTAVAVAACLSVVAAGAALAAEREPLKPRVPGDRLEELRKQANPVAVTAESIQRGEAVFRGVGSCNVCHGETGDGKGIGASGLDPSPRDLTNAKWQKARSDGELMWVLKHGSPGTAMITVVPGLISEEDGWNVINFVRSLKK
ncbi:MAG: c-type cytochrome [Nitrospirota bacterium]|nr:c-type cytochrome [Nitrospirota bacterium]